MSWLLAVLCFATVMFPALVCATALGKGWLGETLATALCVVVQQLIWATAAFRVQQQFLAHRREGRPVGTLLGIGLVALYFSVSIPSLFQNIAENGPTVPLDPSNTLYALPVVLVALVGLVRIGRR